MNRPIRLVRFCILLTMAIVLISLFGCKQKPKDTTSLSETTITTAATTTEQTTVTQLKTTEKTAKTANASSPKPTVTETTRKRVTITVPEGYSFMQITNLLANKGVCSKKSFFDAAQSYQVKSFTIPSSANRCFKLEGYLYPDTYEFYADDDPVDVIRKMLNNYAAKSGMPSDKTLIIASVIEKEARSSSNFKMVSSVFKNRLNKSMKLEADSTRKYVNTYITGNSLLSGTSKYAALYNTYKCSLPAGPICSPGARAIEAAKNPANSDYVYFFFGNDNENHYSKTFAEHEEQIKQYGVQYD
ncbi:MAG: hypothetical protein BGN88_14615 [Clostridiales bacterium 43-6]|nr:MAG: hypothetical protein BGN88_14615 [Clostridiales bacterium 43-6]